MLMTPPPGTGGSPGTTAFGAARQQSPLLNPSGTQRPLGMGLSGTQPGLSQNPLGQANQQAMMMKLLRGY